MKSLSRTGARSLLAAAVIATAAACGGGSSDVSQTQGTVRFALTDAPACGFDQVNITVERIRVHTSANAGESDSGWSELRLNPAQKINLLNLTNGVLQELGQMPLPAGQYTQLRLVLAANGAGSPANSVVPTGGAETAMSTPSGIQSGIKLVHQFTVQSGAMADVVLDFDACRSVVTRGNGTYSMKPVVQVVPRNVTAITGYVDPAVAGVTVSAQKGGNVVRATAPDAAGKFTLAYLDPAQGPYDVVLTAPQRSSAVVAAVPVTTTSVVNLSTSAAPIPMPQGAAPASRDATGTVTLNPPTGATEATVRALQAVGSVPAVEIGFVNSNATGGYTISLPTAAPRLASFSTTLPLTFNAQSASAAKYTLQASAAGYASKSTVPPIDLSGGNATWNVTLTP
jgi:hypothetical protein